MFRRGFKAWCENVSAQYRRDLDLHPHDPLDPVALAAHLGVQLWHPDVVPGVEEKHLRVLLRDDPDSWSAITICVGTKSVVIVNSSHSRARQASDIMHELAHIILAHKPARMDVTEDGIMILSTFATLQEQEAAWLSGCLLLPRAALVAIVQSRLDGAAAAVRYGVSADMLQYRRSVTAVDRQFRNVRRKSTA
jgi:Zn-dependent peptidase ImmA (M78 family)